MAVESTVTPDEVSIFHRMGWSPTKLSRVADVPYQHARRALMYESIPTESEEAIRSLSMQIAALKSEDENEVKIPRALFRRLLEW